MASTTYYADWEGGGAGVIVWEFTQGDTATRQFTVRNTATGAVVDITGWTSFRFTAKDLFSDADNQATLSETLAGGGILKVTAASGLGSVTVLPADTVSLGVERRELVADLQGVDASANVWTLARANGAVGSVVINPHVSRTNP